MKPRASFTLWLHIVLSRLFSGATVSSRDWPKRPQGPLVWIIPDTSPESAGGISMLLRRLGQLRPDLNVIVSAGADIAHILPPDIIRLSPLPDAAGPVHAALRHWGPDLIVLTGRQLPVTLIGLAFQYKIPVICVDAVAPTARSRLNRAALSRLSRISVRAPATMEQLAQMGADPSCMEVGGVLAEPPDPLACSEAERASMAKAISTRPVWFAATVPPAELVPVLEAQVHAQRLAHRMLLILAPTPSEDPMVLAQRLTEQGWIVGRRSVEAEPDDDTQIFLADDPDEYGLWYRIAPVTYMGGTLCGAARMRSPLEAALLGSAIIHGPQTAPFDADYARLDEARATRQITETTALAEAVADLMAVDRAAMLAHNAWAVTSGGAGAVEAVARAVLIDLPPTSQETGPHAHA